MALLVYLMHSQMTLLYSIRDIPNALEYICRIVYLNAPLYVNTKYITNILSIISHSIYLKI